MSKRMMKSNLMRKNGFTLIELLVAVVIVGVLAAAGIPGMRTLSDNVAARSVTDKLANALNYARGQAVLTLTNTSVCGGTACGGNWSDGWVVSSEGSRVEDISQNDATVIMTGNGGAAVVNFDRFGENTSTESATFTITVGSATPRSVSVSTIGTVSINQ